jgi:hypothetical protein
VRVRWHLAAAMLASLPALAGCTLDPSVADTLPPIEKMETRVTKGPNTDDQYAGSVQVEPGNIVQVRTMIADGNAVEVRMPRGPVDEAVVTSEAENGDSHEVTLESATGEEFELHRLFQYDPGYIGVEDQSDEDELGIRIATSRLTGAGQGQVPFTFKVKVR